MALIDTTPTCYSPEVAERLAAELNAGDDDWEYRVKHDPCGTGYSLIEVYDAEGEFVAKI